MINPLFKKPIEIVQVVFPPDWRLREMLAGHLPEIISRSEFVVITIDEVGHHGKEGLTLSGAGIGQKKMKHAQHQGPLVVDQGLIRSLSFAGAQSMTEDDWPHVNQPALAQTGFRFGGELQRFT